MIPFNLTFTKSRYKSLARQVVQTGGGTADDIESFLHQYKNIWRLKLNNTATTKYCIGMKTEIANSSVFNGSFKIVSVNYDSTDDKILLDIESPNYNHRDIDVTTTSLGTATPDGLTPLGIHEKGTPVFNNVRDIIGYEYTDTSAVFVLDVQANVSKGKTYIQVVNNHATDALDGGATNAINIEYGIDLVNWHAFSTPKVADTLAAGNAEIFEIDKEDTGIFIRITITNDNEVPFMVMMRD